MAIYQLDQEACTGCGVCFASCPQDVFRMDEKTGKAGIKYGKDCVACWACELFCPVGCIKVSPGRARELPLPY
jgi:NAD-dependent dihydropyrimidine dehydrogenase PreA subunit